ncbi:hypothetical protein [Thioclava atlantica]|nr:hypothetical protein [Thioclava atlantica]
MNFLEPKMSFHPRDFTSRPAANDNGDTPASHDFSQIVSAEQFVRFLARVETHRLHAANENAAPGPGQIQE